MTYTKPYDYLEIPGHGPGAGLLVSVGDRIMLEEGDWHEVVSYSADQIVAASGLTIDPSSVVAVKLPSDE